MYQYQSKADQTKSSQVSSSKQRDLTLVPAADGEEGLEVGVDLLEVGEAVVGAEAPVLGEVVVLVQAHDLVGLLVQPGEAEDDVGTDERVDVLHVELAGAPPGGQFINLLESSLNLRIINYR